MGPVSGFILETNGEPSLYITGDTIWCKEVAKALDNYQPQITVAFVGAAQFLKGCPITMSTEDIAQICYHTPNTQVIAVHMESFNHCLLSRIQLHNYLKHKQLNEKVFIPENGDCLEF